MTRWIRFEYEGRAQFGTLEGDTITAADLPRDVRERRVHDEDAPKLPSEVVVLTPADGNRLGAAASRRPLGLPALRLPGRLRFGRGGRGTGGILCRPDRATV